jgi:hypothetical protein
VLKVVLWIVKFSAHHRLADRTGEGAGRGGEEMEKSPRLIVIHDFVATLFEKAMF